jgi:hypothetical protein
MAAAEAKSTPFGPEQLVRCTTIDVEKGNAEKRARKRGLSPIKGTGLRRKGTGLAGKGTDPFRDPG